MALNWFSPLTTTLKSSPITFVTRLYACILTLFNVKVFDFFYHKLLRLLFLLYPVKKFEKIYFEVLSENSPTYAGGYSSLHGPFAPKTICGIIVIINATVIKKLKNFTFHIHSPFCSHKSYFRQNPVLWKSCLMIKS